MIHFPPIYNQILIVLINIIGVWLALAVWKHRGKGFTEKLFVFMIFLMFGWVDFAYLPRVIGSVFPSLALASLKIAWFMTPLFFAALYFLVIYLGKTEHRYRILSIFIALLGLGSGIATAGTNLVVTGMHASENIVRINYGVGMLPFLGIIVLIIGVTLFVTFQSYVSLDSARKKQMQYFIVGLIIFYFANAVFNIILPIIFDVVRWYWIGDYSTLAVLGFTGYAIVTRKLFGIRVVLAALLVGAISILLLLDLIVLTNVIWMQAVKGFSFLLFLVLGYALVRSIEKEIESRDELALAYEKLKELDKAKSEFISIASHQLRTPLTAIKGYVSMILEGTYGRLTKKLEAPVRSVADSNDRLIKLVNNLLNISRIESGKIKMEIENVNVKEVGESVQKELGGKMQEKNIVFEIEESSAGNHIIRADREKVRNILMNIIDNAIRYTSEGTITMAIKRAEGDMLRIEIRDTGEGMTKEEIAGLFESFTRGKAGQRLWTEGAGLGLYIAKKFADMHGGRIWAESEGKGKGSAFIVELPRTDTEE